MHKVFLVDTATGPRLERRTALGTSRGMATTTPDLRLRAPVRKGQDSKPTSNGHSQELSQEKIDGIDPFTYYPPFTACQKLITFFNLLWLAPIRFVLFVAPSVILGSVMCLLGLVGDHYDINDPKPLSKWGSFVHQRINPFIARWFLLGFGFNWISVSGAPAPSTEAPIFVVAPHTSMLDVFVLMIFGVPTFVARGESQHVPFFGTIIKKSVRAIFVYREDPESRAKSAVELQRRVNDKRLWPNVLICPEGTTTNKKVMLKFKLGAFLPKLPVQPILINFKNKLDTTSWGGDGIDWFGTLLFTGCQFHNPLEIEFLPVYCPSQAEKDDCRLYADNVQRVMSRRVQLPIGNQAVEDLMLMRHAKSAGLPFSKGMVVYFTANQKTGLKLKEMKRYLTRFAVIDRDKDGYITANDLATFLKVPKDACLQAVFDNCKKTAAGGRVMFVDYLCGLIKVSSDLLGNQQFLQEMFTFFDSNDDGRVSLDDVTRALSTQTLPEANGTPPNMDIDDFKIFLCARPEYVVLFHEHQNVRKSPVHSNGRVPIQNGNNVNGSYLSNSKQTVSTLLPNNVTPVVVSS
ncbi:lysophosphatidylcholine acyltransferase 2-like isoform X2 [Halichondria panicea]|uniref:lysophosphatidylcholine acyltransferase 2-like isoform X2 n=1 Tax=Halichondria panicea TaxID=6063 RepID=UPI00312B8146